MATDVAHQGPLLRLNKLQNRLLVPTPGNGTNRSAVETVLDSKTKIERSAYSRLGNSHLRQVIVLGAEGGGL